jgi:hypothetical protein
MYENERLMPYYRTLAYPEGGFGGFKRLPPTLFRSFDKAEPNSQWKIDLKNLIRIRVSPICKLGGTPD